MVWRTFKNMVVEKLEQHNLGYVSVSSDDLTTSAVATTFDARCLLYFKNFVAECEMLYEPKLALTIPAGNPQQLDLSSNSVVTKDVYRARAIWLDGRRVPMMGTSAMISDTLYPTADAGFPNGWHMYEPYKVWFDKPLGDDYADSSVAGYVAHVDLTSDSSSEGATTTLLIADRWTDAAADYCALKFMGAVTIDSGGALQLSNTDKLANEMIRLIKARLRVERTGSVVRGSG